MSFDPGDETIAEGTMARAIYDAMVDKIGENEAIAEARKKAAAALAIGICEHANPRLAEGSVVGPDSATDNAVARFDGTTGSLIQSSPVTIDDSGNIAGVGTVDGRDISADGAALDAHLANTSNPHGVTASQVGAPPTTLTITATSPIRIDGGASADLSANRTLSILAASASNAGSMSAADFAKLAAMSDGSYTPTMTPVTNLDSATGLESLYIKCGSMCLVGFAATVDPTTTGACEALLSLPFSSAFTTFRDATGICGGVSSSNGRIDGSAADDAARVSWTAAGTGQTTLFGLFVYRIK